MTVVAEWGNKTYNAELNSYGVATIKAGSMPIEDHTPETRGADEGSEALPDVHEYSGACPISRARRFEKPLA